MKHREAYELHAKKRGRRAIIGILLGILCLILYNFLKNSPDLADFMEMVECGRVDDALFFQVLAALLLYVLPVAGTTAVLTAVYVLLFKRDSSS